MASGRTASFLAAPLIACLAGCSAVAPRLAMSPECSGIPGDPAHPNPQLLPDPATHGPGTAGKPELLEAVRPVELMPSLPGLYVFGPDGEYVSRLHRRDSRLADPAFDRAEEASYWSEVVGGHVFHIPEVAPCLIDSMVDKRLSFRAPTGGLLFVQLIGEGCRECRAIEAAIESVVDQHPQLAVRWVQIEVPKRFATID
jgi:hypothetical protein